MIDMTENEVKLVDGGKSKEMKIVQLDTCFLIYTNDEHYPARKVVYPEEFPDANSIYNKLSDYDKSMYNLLYELLGYFGYTRDLIIKQI